MSNDADARYEEILRKIAERKAREQAQSALTARRDALMRALDLLNAHDALAALGAVAQQHGHWYGPDVRAGTTWSAVVIWGCPRKYRGYRQLTLIGVWALHKEDGIQIVVGKRQLAFKPDFYEAEAFYKLIRSGFDVYYADDGRPPAPNEGRLYDEPYDLAGRLEQRRAVIGALQGLSLLF